MATAPQPTLLAEGSWALSGTWRLLLGREDARACFDFSQRGLAGSFVALVLATVMLVGLVGIGPADRFGMSAAMQIFILGAITALRLSALRVILPRLDALDAFRPYMVASNWTSAIVLTTFASATVASVFVGALILGPASGEALVGMVMTIWATLAVAMLVVDINILRIVAGLGSAAIVLALAGQVFAVLSGLSLLGLVLQG